MGKKLGNLHRLAVAVGVAVLAVAVSAVGPVPVPAASADPPVLPAPDSNGITVTNPGDAPTLVDLDEDGVISGSEQRLIELSMTTAAIYRARPGSTPTINPLNIPIRLRVYLPNGYDPGRAQPYPVLYLLHGGNGDFDDWSRPAEGNVTGIVDAQSAFNGIVVMPEGGDAGWYSNWYGYTTDNFRPDWETFHLDQLVGWVDANFNTSGTAGGRAIAGLSMGGFGTLKYAGTNPGLFSAIGSFSGPADLRNELFQFTVAASMTGRGATVGEGSGDPYGEAYTGSKYLVSGTEYNPPETAALGPEAGWPSINPVQLAEAGAYDAYSGDVYLYSGDGAGSFFDVFEQAINETDDALHAALGGAGVVHRYCTGPGNHAWSFWREDLEDFLAFAYGTGRPGCTDNANWHAGP